MRYTFVAEKKDPEAILDYVIDWTQYLAPEEVIQDFNVTCEGGGVTVSGSTEADGRVRFMLSGGVAGRDYSIVCEIITNAGRTDQRTINLPVRQR